MKTLTIILAIFGVMAFTQEASAQEKKKGGPEKAFAKMDADGSGSFSLEEYTAYREMRAAKRAEKQAANGVEPKGKKEKDPAKAFAKMDANNDGAVDMAEFKAHKAKMKAKKAKRKAKKKAKGGN
ncbi:MAG: hypothetical protein AB8F95_18975 [Bacteroidia bacterium]